jgi:hypothetical protein
MQYFVIFGIKPTMVGAAVGPDVPDLYSVDFGSKIDGTGRATLALKGLKYNKYTSNQPGQLSQYSD